VGDNVIDQEIRRIRFMDWLLACETDKPGDPATVGEFFGGDGYPPGERDQQIWRGLIRGLRDDGFIYLGESMDFWSGSAWLSDAGRKDVEERRARRADRAARDAACRTAVVKWLDRLPRRATGPADMTPFFSDENKLKYYEGLPFELEEVDDALRYLKKRGLVGGVDVAENRGRPLQPHLEEDGMDCVSAFDGDVGRYLRRNEGRGVQNNVSTYFGGDVSGSPISIASAGNVTQTINSGAGAGDIVELLREIAAAAPSLGLSERDAAGLRNAAEEAEGELTSDERDDNWFVQTIRRTGQLLGKASGSVTAMALYAYLRAWAEERGITLGDPPMLP
jgi:hypothetical protein